MATNTLPDARPASSALDREWQVVGEIPDGQEQEIDEEWCNAETEHRLPAIPKTSSLPPAVEPGRGRSRTTPGAPATQHIAQAGDMAVPPPQDHGTAVSLSPQSSPVTTGNHRAVVVDRPVPVPSSEHGASFPEASLLTDRDAELPLPGIAVESPRQPLPPPPVEPGATSPRTMRATVIPPPPQVLVTASEFKSVEEWKEAQEAFVEQLRGLWKTASPAFRKECGHWNVYRKKYLDRWLNVNPDPTHVQFTPDGKVLFDEWCSLFKARVDAGKANIEAANWLAERLIPWVEVLTLSRAEVLRDFKGWCYTNDKKGYYTRGVKLFDLRREFEGWQSYQQSLLDKAEREKSRPQNKYGTVSGLPHLEPSQEWLEAMGGR